jgi:hypothetical protein
MASAKRAKRSRGWSGLTKIVTNGLYCLVSGRDPLCSEPRFRALLRGMNFPP